MQTRPGQRFPAGRKKDRDDVARVTGRPSGSQTPAASPPPQSPSVGFADISAEKGEDPRWGGPRGPYPPPRSVARQRDVLEEAVKTCYGIVGAGVILKFIKNR